MLGHKFEAFVGKDQLPFNFFIDKSTGISTDV